MILAGVSEGHLFRSNWRKLSLVRKNEANSQREEKRVEMNREKKSPDEII